jgi:hypothetical protein
MRRLHLVLGMLWLGSSETLKASYSSIFWQNDAPSTQLIIRSFLKPSKATSLSFKTTRSISQKRLSPPQQEHWRKCIGRYCHIPPIVLTWRQAIFTFKVHSKGT